MGIGESLTLHVTNLPDYCKRADNQNKRNQKLNYNQYFPYPVATFAIGEAGAANAALFAVSLLANENAELAQKLADFRHTQQEAVLEMTLPEMMD